MHEERDQQRSKLYKAERYALTDIETRLPTTTDVEKYLAKLFKRAPIQRRYGKYLKRQIVVKDGRGRINAGGCSDYITLPLWARCDWVALHEVSHAITQRKHGDYVAAHGWQFASIFLDLVRFGMGKEAYAALKASFKLHRVRTKPKKSRIVTSEMLERLANARAMKKAG